MDCRGDHKEKLGESKSTLMEGGINRWTVSQDNNNNN